MHSYSVILKALRAEGLKVVEVPGARNRCRCHGGAHRVTGPFARSWAPTGDTMVHITAGDRGSRTALQYIADIINGDPSVPTKANFVPDYDGTVYLNSAGRCNHAGRVGSGALGRIRSQSLPLSGWIGSLRGHDVDGNTWVYGIENIAAHTMSPRQREASVRICAAMARLDRRNGQGTPGHGEASDQRGYPDPNLNMGEFRRDVMARLRTSPTPTARPIDEGFFGMTNDFTYSNGIDRKIKSRRTALLRITKGGRVSLVTGAKTCIATVTVHIAGIKPGDSATLKLTTKNMKSGKYTDRAIVTLVGDSDGDAKGQVTWSGTVRKGDRLRTTLRPDTSNDVTLTYVHATGFTK